VSLQLSQWANFLGLDTATVATLREFLPLIEPHMDRLMTVLYSRIQADGEAAALFASPQAMAHARERQRAHWLDTVFVGRFDAEYMKAALTIGRTHFRLGVDPRLYSGAYLVVLNEAVAIAIDALAHRPDDLRRYVQALNRAVHLDMGLATSVYYDALNTQLEEMSHELNMSLARAGEYRDNETGRHIMRMSHMCERLALQLGCDPRWAQMLRIASPLHDVGKIGIPDAILLKPGRLDPDEMNTMRHHAAIGAEIIPEHQAEVISMARRIALTHHERWDGNGYPAGLKGEEIPLEGRIAAICDVYDALVSKRPYKRAWSRQEALEHLRTNADAHFDPRLVAAFIDAVEDMDAIQQRFCEEG
jgi:putative two-component system response regulator